MRIHHHAADGILHLPGIRSGFMVVMVSGMGAMVVAVLVLVA
jgi:hypothetical protein